MVEKAKGDDGRVGHHWDEYDTRGGDIVDVDVNQGLMEARKEEERRESMKKPKMADDYEYKVGCRLRDGTLGGPGKEGENC